MKKTMTILLALLLSLSFLSACSSMQNTPKVSDVPLITEPISINIAGMKGPTTMGMVKLMEGQEAGLYPNNYNVTMYGTSDEIVPKIISGEIDIAAVPANLASVLYAKTEGKIEVAAVNTLGVLYIIETGETISEISDIKGKTIYTTGKGTTPEYVLNYILTSNGIDPTKDVKIEYKSEATEVVAAMQMSKESVIAMLPQPYVTTVLETLPNARIALNMNEEWNKTNTEFSLVTGVLIARTDFIKKNPEAFEKFLKDYKASTEFANTNVKETAELVVKYGIVSKLEIAEKAIPLCNICYIEGDEMKKAVSGYLKVLFEQNAASVGGTLPDDKFYFNAK